MSACSLDAIVPECESLLSGAPTASTGLAPLSRRSGSVRLFSTRSGSGGSSADGHGGRVRRRALSTACCENQYSCRHQHDDIRPQCWLAADKPYEQCVMRQLQLHAGDESDTLPGCDARALHVQILRMSSSAAVNEALLSQLNVARAKVRRNSGSGGGDSGGGGGTGGSNPLAAGSAAAVIIAASAIKGAVACQVSSQGEQPPSDAVPDKLQQRIPSAASADGTSMYGVFEDTAWSPAAGDAEKEAAAVVVAAPPGSGGTANGSASPAYLNPFAAAAEQRQQQSRDERLAAQEAAESKERAKDAQDTAYDRSSLGNSKPNDSAHVCHGSSRGKGQDLVREDSAVEVPLATSAPAAMKGAVRSRPSPMNDYYSAFRSATWHIDAARCPASFDATSYTAASFSGLSAHKL
jgi:hypothetical protein